MCECPGNWIHIDGNADAELVWPVERVEAAACGQQDGHVAAVSVPVSDSADITDIYCERAKDTSPENLKIKQKLKKIKHICC